MTRKEKVYRTLKDLTDNLTFDDIIKGSSIGIDAKTISNITHIDRSNVSKELNNLVREEKVIKIIGRPVMFLAKESLERIISINYKGDFVFKNITEFIESLDLKCSEFTGAEHDPFSKIIGADGSLEVAIKQAKAAILYPPKGLHTLITGPTGVGKTIFAEMMYKYAIFSGVIPKDPNLLFLTVLNMRTIHN